MSNLENINIFNFISGVIHCMSLICILASLIIFYTHTSLNCSRITIHKNMFLALGCNNFFWISLYTMVYILGDQLIDSLIWCRLLYMVTTYFMMSTYFWMLCEGIFLRILLDFMVIPNEGSLVKSLVILGWVGPLVVVTPYFLHKYYYENEFCWMDQGWSNHILGIPTACILLINTAIVISVMWKMKKRNVEHQNSSQTNYAKAILVLMTIFGLQYMLLPFRPQHGTVLEKIYEAISCIVTSTQGMVMSILLCFTNSEVKNILKRRYRRSTVVMELQIMDRRDNSQSFNHSN